MVDIKVNLTVTVKKKISQASESASFTFFLLFLPLKVQKLLIFVSDSWYYIVAGRNTLYTRVFGLTSQYLLFLLARAGG